MFGSYTIILYLFFYENYYYAYYHEINVITIYTFPNIYFIVILCLRGWSEMMSNGVEW